MDEYLWNNRVEYLIKSRKTMWNDDYLQFLIERVWGITEPVSIVDFGCGMGFMGAMLLPGEFTALMQYVHEINGFDAEGFEEAKAEVKNS